MVVLVVPDGAGPVTPPDVLLPTVEATVLLLLLLLLLCDGG